MSILEVPGAHLYYEAVGDGPLLVLIPGAAGTGEVFHPLVESLAKRYRVTTYDRRGFSRSELDGVQDYDRRLDTDADDVRHLIEHLTNKPAIVFGNSSGAIVALEVLIHFPAQVRTVVAHEPPLVNLMPDAATWLAFFDAVYLTYRKQGIPEAMHQFADKILGSGDHQLLHHATRENPGEYTLPNAQYWMEHELRQYPQVDLNLDTPAARAKQLVLAGGQDSRDQMTYQPNKILAQRLGLDVVDFPGGHLGFMADPDAFAKKLLDVLKD